MDIKQLKYFTAICRFKNLSHAADSCNIAPSALSHHISNLEHELETALFVRKTRGMEPTSDGLKLLEHAERILANIDAAITDVKYGRADIHGNITIGMPYSVIKVIGSDLMKEVLDDHPKVKLVIKEGLSSNNFEALSKDQIELAIAFNPAKDGTTDRLPLLKEELFCIGHHSIIGTSKKPLTFDNLSSLPIALLQGGDLSRALIDRPGAIAKLEDKSIIQLASVSATLSALKSKIGCTLAPKVLVSEMLLSGDVSARSVKDPKPVRTLFLITSNNKPTTLLRETISEIIIRLIHEAVKNGNWISATAI